MPAIIDHIVGGDVERFTATFSATPFPGASPRLTWLRAEFGGNFNRLADSSMEGRLCPALFHYFREAPKTICMKATLE